MTCPHCGRHRPNHPPLPCLDAWVAATLNRRPVEAQSGEAYAVLDAGGTLCVETLPGGFYFRVEALALAGGEGLTQQALCGRPILWALPAFSADRRAAALLLALAERAEAPVRSRFVELLAAEGRRLDRRDDPGLAAFQSTPLAVCQALLVLSGGAAGPLVYPRGVVAGELVATLA